MLKNWPELEGLSVTVRYRRAGDKFYRTKDSQGKSLKNYFQEKPKKGQENRLTGVQKSAQTSVWKTHTTHY